MLIAFVDIFYGDDVRDKRKMHLCKWDDVCRPKRAGSLGLRHAKYSNLAFM